VQIGVGAGMLLSQRGQQQQGQQQGQQQAAPILPTPTPTIRP
jgi:hypothetical protein